MSFLDYDLFKIIVETVSEAAALKKAQRIYNLNGGASGESCPDTEVAMNCVREASR